MTIDNAWFIYKTQKTIIQGGGDATETTLTILEIIKEKKRKENRAKKVPIRQCLNS